jgi:hypothetical protein
MHETLIRRSVQCALTAAFLCMVSSPMTAGSFTRGCAARDLQILMLIEDRESSSLVSTGALSDALLALLEARIVCYEGRVVDAMELYDDIAKSIAPDTILSARRK